MVCEGWEGNTVDGKFPLLEWLRGWADRCVFLTVRQGAQKANIKLVVASGRDAEAHLRNWEAAKSLYHPFLVQLMEMGRSTVHESDVVYLVTEKTDTFLSGIIPRKALGPSEVRVILEPILDALSFLHGKGLAHGNVKPSNIVQVGEQWKLGSDEMGSGDLANAARKPDGYDAPEIAEGRLTPAADMWSLGIIMVEAFAQRTPVWDREAKADLGVPVWVMAEPFREIARGCLRWEPADRISVEDAKALLARYTLSADAAAPVAAEVVPEPYADQKKDPRAVAAEPLDSFRAEPEPVEFAPRSRLFNLEEEEHTGRKGSFGVAILVLLAVVAVLAIRFRGRLFPPHETQNAPAESQAAQPKSQAPQSEPGSEQPPPSPNPSQPAPSATQTPAKNPPAQNPPAQEGSTTSQTAPTNQPTAETQPAPNATKPQEVAPPEQPKTASETKPETAPAESSDEAATKPLANSQGAVVKRVLPNVERGATGSMRRPMDVELRVSVNEEGRVANVQYMTLGPGNYFARKAHQAAEGWKFKPPHSNGQAVASKWVLLFRFERGRTDVTATEIH